MSDLKVKTLHQPVGINFPFIEEIVIKNNLQYSLGVARSHRLQGISLTPVTFYRKILNGRNRTLSHRLSDRTDGSLNSWESNAVANSW